MSTRSFRSVFMVASCAGAALGCYLVSLRVASERAALEDVETEIVLAQRDLRLLQTEIGTRGRLAQLERWNVKVLALSAPSADQFLDGGFELAKMVTPQHKVDLDAPVVLASAPANAGKPQPEGLQPGQESRSTDGLSASQMMQVASLKRDSGDAREAVLSLTPSRPKPVTEKPAAPAKVAAAPKANAKAKSIAPDKQVAKSDPLAPLAKPAKPKTLAAATARDSAHKQ